MPKTWLNSFSLFSYAFSKLAFAALNLARFLRYEASISSAVRLSTSGALGSGYLAGTGALANVEVLRLAATPGLRFARFARPGGT